MRKELKARSPTKGGINHVRQYLEGRAAKRQGKEPDNEYESFSQKDSAFMAGYHSTKNSM